MTPTLAMTVFLIGTVVWFVIRIPARRRARKAAVKSSARGTRETILMALSLTGLGIIPLVYIASNFGSAAIGRHRSMIGTDADRFSELWRTKQLEYSWTLTKLLAI